MPATAPRTVLVTGANAGIGLATVVEVARAGFDVVGTVRSPDKADDVAEAAAQAGVEVRTTVLDVTDEARCRQVVDETTPWAVVNNAGYAEAGAVTEVSDDEARAQLETLVLAPARLARLAAAGMRAQGSGRIVNISSVAAEVSSPLLGWYQGAKRALEGISDAMRLELARDGIDVVLLQPGAVRTGIWDDARDRVSAENQETAERWRAITARLEPHMASAEAVARVVREVLEVKRPRDRYPVGLDAQVLTRVARVAPASLTDAITKAMLKLS